MLPYAFGLIIHLLPKNHVEFHSFVNFCDSFMGISKRKISTIIDNKLHPLKCFYLYLKGAHIKDQSNNFWIIWKHNSYAVGEEEKGIINLIKAFKRFG